MYLKEDVSSALITKVRTNQDELEACLNSYDRLLYSCEELEFNLSTT